METNSNRIVAASAPASAGHGLNVDLHCHSSVSDGMLAPAELAQRAKDNGVQIWSLTDHDEVGGQHEAAAAARVLGIHYVPGVEISVSWGDETVHIVGLGIDPTHPLLLEGLAATRNGRAARARKIGDQLAEAGISGAFDGAFEFVGNPDLISRTHFARFLVESGRCKDVRDVFTRYLVAGKPGYVPMEWATLGNSIDWIRSAGGIAIIAHPGRYRFNAAALHAFLAEFKQLGGTGIEVVTGSHSVDQYRTFARHAVEFGFLASRGSDFHGPGESRIDLGALPPLPESVLPVWHDWPHGFHGH